MTVKNEKCGITTYSTDIKRIRGYYEKLCTSKLHNLDEMDKFLAICPLPILHLLFIYFNFWLHWVLLAA